MLKLSDLCRIGREAEQWFDCAGRKLSFREGRTPYRVWISEVMLQQTQVFKVIDYFDRFMARFPSVEQLATAPEDEVLSYWSGLGYYSRCRNLHRAAKLIMNEHGGIFPDNFDAISSLPGIGSYTAGAICSFAFNQVVPVVDGNIARVLSRLGADATAFDSPKGKKHFESLSLEFAKASARPGLVHEALMEIGATVCTPNAPLCESCPLAEFCESRRAGTALSFPTKSKKVAKKELHGVFAIIGNDDKVWLERNEKSRLFKSLYAPPHVMIASAKEAERALLEVSRQFSFDLPQKLPEPNLVVRELTHRTFYLHGYKIPSSSDMPNARWFTKSELSQIGLSSAVTALLKQTGFLSLVLLMSMSCTHVERSVRRAPKSRQVVVPAEPADQALPSWRSDIVSAALGFVGKKQVSIGKVYFRRDCSGTVRGIFEKAKKSLKEARGRRGESDSQALYDYAKKIGSVSLNDPKIGDMVFFHDTYDVNHDGRMNDGISHVGVVTKVLEGDNVVFVHFAQGGRGIVESTLDEELRRPGRKFKAKTGRELLSGYGQLE